MSARDCHPFADPHVTIMVRPKQTTRLPLDRKLTNCPQDVCVADFWSWAYSDLLQNTTRGVLAEYIVAILLDAAEEVRSPWNAYDLTLKNGKTVEVKTMSKLQAWAQQGLSAPKIVLAPTRFWDPQTGKMEAEASFNADHYVFCYFTSEDHETADPLDLSQWRFYVFGRESLIRILGKDKSISLRRLEREGVQPVEAADLKRAIELLD